MIRLSMVLAAMYVAVFAQTITPRARDAVTNLVLGGGDSVSVSAHGYGAGPKSE